MCCMSRHAFSSSSSESRRRPSLEPLLRSASTMTDPNSERDTKLRANLEQYEQLFGADEDAFDQPTTTRKELWSYYLYYNGDNGVGPGSYSQTL